jgi:hypothetical protein
MDDDLDVRAFRPAPRFAWTAQRHQIAVWLAATGFACAATALALLVARRHLTDHQFATHARMAMDDTLLARLSSAPAALAELVHQGRMALRLDDELGEVTADALSRRTTSNTRRAIVDITTAGRSNERAADPGLNPASAAVAAQPSRSALVEGPASVKKLDPARMQQAASAPPQQSTPPAPVTDGDVQRALQRNTVEMVSRQLARVEKIESGRVVLSNGRSIVVGATFTSGERLLATDPSHDQFVTDRRTIVVF